MAPTPQEEFEYWNGKSIEAARTELDTVQRSATGWTALFSAVLALFGTVAFAGGLTTLDKLAEPWDLVVRILTSVAAGAALVATFCGARASSSLSPREASELDAAGLKQRSREAAKTSLGFLTASKVAGAIAAISVLLGSAAVLWLGESPSGPPTVVVVSGGEATCGKLGRASDGGLTVAGRAPDREITSVVTVSKCS